MSHKVNFLESTLTGTSAGVLFSSSTGYITGHYTQVVWGATTKIGCGRLQYKPSGARSGKEMIICNYGKAGNFIRYIETLE